MNYESVNNTTIGTVPMIIPTGEPISTAVASIIATVALSWGDWFNHPAQDARNIIAQVKPQLPLSDARGRLAYVLAAGKKISDKAKDVEAAELLLWYRQAYPNDYLELTQADMSYFNDYVSMIMGGHADGNNLYINLRNSYFPQDQLSYSPSTGSGTGTNILTQLTNTTGISPVVLFGGIGLIVVYLISKK